MNNSVQHWPIIIIFGTQHYEATRRERVYYSPSYLNTVATLSCEMPKS